MFRLFVGFRVLFYVMVQLRLLGHPKLTLYGWVGIAALLESALLLGYLSWPLLKQKLGRFYLPLGLAIATAGPLLENMAFSATFPSNIIPPPSFPGFDFYRTLALANQMQMTLILFIPLILVSSQYSLRSLLGFNLGILLLDLGQALFAPDPGSSQLWFVIGRNTARVSAFLLVGFVVNRLAAEQKQQNRHLEQANQRLRHYADTLEQLTTSRERNRLAREMHDTLAHTLSGLAVNLEAVTALWQDDPDQAHGILDQSLNVTRSGLVETRRAIQALRASPLDDLGLKLSLEQLARSTADRFALKLELHLPEMLENLDPELEHCLYRVAEEGLRNIGQHARASQFSLALKRTDKQLDLVLTDDGAGFDQSAHLQEESFGIRGMRERVEAVGGQFELTSQPGQGTRLHVRLEEGGSP